MAIDILKIGNELKISIIDNLSDIKLMRKVIEMWLEALDVDEFKIMAVKLCVHEAVNNGIIHGYKESHKRKKIVDVHIKIEKNRIKILVQDFGSEDWYSEYQQLLKSDSPLLNTEDPRGRGLIIIKKLADMLKIENMKNKGTKIHMEIDLTSQNMLY